ncbi:hypothetical protein [Flaviflagellibacter deserti]|uniref:Uncharacterized protein n=1 Tax=Flaviflagellibacter deserti TaxID=2267266 RepID=A0ABV9Z390_9HYPH
MVLKTSPARIVLCLVAGLSFASSVAAQDTTPSATSRPAQQQKQPVRQVKPGPAPSPATPQTIAPAQTAPAPAAPAAPSNLPPSVGSVPTDVVMVRVVGPWEADGRKGFSRLVATAFGGQLSMHVQWISDAGEIVATQELEGSAEAPQLALATVRAENGKDNSAVYFDTPEDAQGFRETFVLIVGQPGDARFGPATN